MLLKQNIFDSKSEINIYKHLKKTWAGKVGIYNHTPVANIMNISTLKTYKRSEINYLWKSNFDFVIASEEDKEFGRPLLIIEFDGLGEGYSNNGEYKQIRETEKDPNRGWKLNLKIRLCEEASIPFVIISYPEFNMISERFSIIDGIIGEVLFNQEFTKRFYKDIHILSNQLLEIKDPEIRQQHIDMYGMEREIEEKMRHNPIARESNRLLYLLKENKIISKSGFSRSMDEEYIVCEFKTYLQTGEQLSEKVKMREVNCEGFFSGNLVEYIAQMLLLRKIAEKHGLY